MFKKTKSCRHGTELSHLNNSIPHKETRKKNCTGAKVTDRSQSITHKPSRYNIDTVDGGARCKSLTRQTWLIQPSVEQGAETLQHKDIQ